MSNKELYPYAPLEENTNIKEELQKKANTNNSFKNSFRNLIKLVKYLIFENPKTKKRHKEYKFLSTILKTFVTFVIFAKILTSVTLSVTGFGFIVELSSIGIDCGLTLINYFFLGEKQYL